MFLNPTYNHGKSQKWEDLFNQALEFKKEDMFNQHISFESEDFYDLYNRSEEELQNIINDYENMFKIIVDDDITYFARTREEAEEKAKKYAATKVHVKILQ